MRLYIFQHTLGSFMLPTKEATSRASTRTSRVPMIKTSTGFVVDGNAGNTEQPSRFTHSGLYLFASEADVRTFMRFLESLEFPAPGVLGRGSAESGTEVDVALPPISSNSPSLGDEISSYLESYTLDRDSEAIAGTKIKIRASFTFVVINQNSSTAYESWFGP